MRWQHSKAARRTLALTITVAAVVWGSHARATSLTVFGETTTPPTPAPTASTPTGAGDVREIFQLNKAIREKQGRLEELRDRIGRYRQSIANAQAKSRTLSSQLAVIEDRAAKKALDIEEASVEREQVELEVRATRLELERVRDRAGHQRRLLSAFLTELARRDRPDPVQAVLMSASVGEYFAERGRIAVLRTDLRRVLGEVRTSGEALAATERELADREAQLRALAERLTEERTALREEQEAKARLLTVTRQSEGRYQQLITELRAEQETIDRDIIALDAEARKRLSAIDAEFGKTGRVAFSWPVPNRGITTRFRDPEYPFRYVYEHPGIDIRASQGTPIAAAAPGYVARAKDAGYGYSYIMLIHPGGFATVYGHVSGIDVQEDTYVTRGQMIGRAGGRPGTRGAGRLTTGSHLHLEVRLNGIPVDPVGYLL